MPKVEIHLEFSVPSDRLNVNQIVALFQEVKAQVIPALVTCYLEATQDLVLGQTLGPKWADAAQGEAPWVCWRLFLLVSNRQFAAPFRIVDGFVFGWGDVAEIAVEALVVEPVHPSQGGQLEVGDRLPWPLVRSVDEFGLVEVVHRFGQRIVVTVPDRTDRRDSTDLFETFGVSDRRVLRPGIRVCHQAFKACAS